MAIILLESEKQSVDKNKKTKALIIVQNLYNKIVSCPVEIMICRNLNNQLTGMVLHCKCNHSQQVIEINHSLFHKYRSKFIQQITKIKNIHDFNKIDLNEYADIFKFFIAVLQDYK